MLITQENYASHSIGTKAHNLFRMAEKGINVPPLFCVTDEEIKCADTFALERFGRDCTVSVRSSSSVEDSAESSFAGQFNTILNVPTAKISSAAESVADAPKSDSFREYCKSCGISPDSVNVTVIVQKMINADLSGVMFTANPQGILNEAVIVVGNGTGDNVVEDKTDTTTYYHSTTEELYYCEKTDSSPEISESTLRSLMETGAEIKALFGCECDIEFAIKDDTIYILQARPITTLSAENAIVLDNSNIVESYPGITLPLTQSFIKEAYYCVFRSVLLRLTGEPKTVAEIDENLRNMVDTANGRVYYRISNWYDVLLFLPFNKKIIPVWQEMLGVKNTAVSSSGRKIGFFTHTKVTLSFFRLIITCPKLMEELEKFFGSIIEEFRTVDLKAAKNEEILAHYQHIKTMVTEKWDLTLVNDMYSFIFTGLLKSRLKAKKIPDYKEAANRCISGINGLESMAPITALLEIAQQTTELDTLRSIDTNDAFYRYAEGNSDTARQLKEYIGLYGDRNIEELKLESKTFRTDPVLLVKRVVQYADEGITLSPSEPAEKLKGLSGFFAKKAALGIKNREKSRLHRARLYGMMRSMMLQIGENMTASGQLAKREDIFYLTYNEIEAAVKCGTPQLQRIAEMREKYAALAQLPAYGRLIFSSGVFDKAPKKVAAIDSANLPDKLNGIPCSQGVARAEVLVVDDPTTHLDSKGKILVTKMTDPGWVFLIAGAAGIIAEKGSLLSHTAIISRELGKPSVVGVDKVTRLLKSGDMVEINGGTGEIMIIHRKERNL